MPLEGIDEKLFTASAEDMKVDGAKRKEIAPIEESDQLSSESDELDAPAASRRPVSASALNPVQAATEQSSLWSGSDVGLERAWRLVRLRNTFHQNQKNPVVHKRNNKPTEIEIWARLLASGQPCMASKLAIMLYGPPCLNSYLTWVQIILSHGCLGACPPSSLVVRVAVPIIILTVTMWFMYSWEQGLAGPLQDWSPGVRRPQFLCLV